MKNNLDYSLLNCTTIVYQRFFEVLLSYGLLIFEKKKSRQFCSCFIEKVLHHRGTSKGQVGRDNNKYVRETEFEIN